MSDDFAPSAWGGWQAELQAEHLVSAVSSGGRAVGFVMADHEGAVWDALDELGLGPGTARPGQLLLCSAEAALDRLLDAPSMEAGFAEVIGTLLDRPAASDGPLHVLDEIGVLARSRGEVSAASELEKLWLEFGRRVDLSLLSVGESLGDGNGRHLEALASAGEPRRGDLETARIVLPPSASAPAGARTFARHVLAGWQLASPAEAVLVVSELSTNAVVHAGSPFAVGLTRLRDAIRVSVSDLSPAFEGGEPVVDGLHGLGIISRLSRRWGVGHGGQGKTVWSELPLSADR